jgi:hypothetical protein
VGDLRTMEMCRLLGCAYRDIINLFYNNKLVPPRKDAYGLYVWTPEDVERARVALANGRVKRPAAGAYRRVRRPAVGA